MPSTSLFARLCLMLLIGVGLATTSLGWGATPGPPVPVDLLAQARAAEAAQQFAAATTAYRAYLEAQPDNDEIRGALARVLSWQGQYDEAMQLYDDILTRHPADLEIRLARARLKAWQQQYPEARRLFERLVDEAPDNVEARRGLADTLYWSGDYAAALPHYETLFATTGDPELAKRIQAVQTAMATPPSPPSLRAVVQRQAPEATLPYRDYVKSGYSYFTSARDVPDEHLWLVEGAKALGAQTLVSRVEVQERFRMQDVVVGGELYSPVGRLGWGYLSASVGIDATVAPQWTLGGEIYQGLGVLHPALAFLEPSLGYRHMHFRETDVDILTPGLTVYFPYNIWLTEKLYYVPDTDSVTLASQLTWRPTPRVQLAFTGAYGNTGERITAVQDIRRVITHSLQATLTFPILAHLSGEIAGYYEDRHGQAIRRGGIFNVIVHW